MSLYNFADAFSHLIQDSDDEEDDEPQVQPQEPHEPEKPQSEQKPSPSVSPLRKSPSPPLSPATPSPLPPLTPPPPLESLVVEEDIINISSSEDEAQEPDNNADSSNLKLKLQDGHRKHLKEYEISKFARIINLKKMYADDFGIDLNSMKLWFDGDPVDDDETPESLDIEDGCVLDVMITNQK